MTAKQPIMIISSFPDSDTARDIARLCLQNKLCACVQVQDHATSLFIWEDKLQEKTESLVYFKTLQHLEKDLYATIAKHHPYDCPEIISCALSHVEPAYLEWITHICQTQNKV